MQENSLYTRFVDFIRDSATVKVIIIGFLIILLTIPTFMVQELMTERLVRRDQSVSEISENWGMDQQICGPFLSIPYKKYYKDKDGNSSYNIEYMHFLPKDLIVSGRLSPSMKHRGIYQAVLYNARLDVKGSFELPDFHDLNVDLESVNWSNAFIAIGISDMKGIKDRITMNLAGKLIEMSPGIDSTDVVSLGVSSKLPIDREKKSIPFEFPLNINGSQQLHFVPVGENTEVTLVSDWPSPSFNGSFLPTSKIDARGFEARWNVLHLNRNYPQFWMGSKHYVSPSAFGVRLYIAADIYQKSMRTVKYSFMFILFTFSAFFFSEILARRRLHPIQYILVGFSISVFYTLLIAISEHFGFDAAYLVSSLSVIFLITGYSKSILKNTRFTMIIFAVLTLLYSYLYLVLQLEDYALLIGSIGLFAVLAVIMYITRRINWYSIDFDGSGT